MKKSLTLVSSSSSPVAFKVSKEGYLYFLHGSYRHPVGSSDTG
ncbi:hypothetical protein AVDCRST_MAG82-1345 [uncultured Rubrobacteraceae bacterium]|uniref:Uncharacterized protein n=1 Tax=uncultured Rubrobacteraceae bacterium TaxID=349277 RepID=A0A6J4PU50_9ACTN|nr:hypothetical protein AVDCRST_MAG82-1345 [uncultured Rubrobacteraceae bacterium]